MSVEDPRKTPAPSPPAVGLWPDTVPNAERASRIVREVACNDDGVRFTALVQHVERELATVETDGDIRPSPAYYRVYRAVEDLADRGIVRTETRADHRIRDGKAVKTTRQNGDLWVYPEWIPPAFRSYSTNSRQTAESPAPESTNRPTERGSLAGHAPTGDGVATVRSCLRDRRHLSPGPRGDGVRAAVVHGLAAHRAGLANGDLRDDRVSSPARVAGRQAAFLDGFEAGVARHTEATVATLTSSPGESGDALDGLTAVAKDAEPLRDHLRTQTPGPGRPPTIVVLDLTDSWLAHLHVVIFGVSPADIDRAALTDYWHGRKGHGYVSDLAPAERRAGRLVFADHPTGDTDRGRFVREYLGEGLHTLRAIAEATPEALHVVAEGATIDVGGTLDRTRAAKAAAIWAAGRPFVSVSTALRESPARLSARGRNHSSRQSPPRPPTPGSGRGTPSKRAAITPARARVVAPPHDRDRPPPRAPLPDPPV